MLRLQRAHCSPRSRHPGGADRAAALGLETVVRSHTRCQSGASHKMARIQFGQTSHSCPRTGCAATPQPDVLEEGAESYLKSYRYILRLRPTRSGVPRADNLARQSHDLTTSTS